MWRMPEATQRLPGRDAWLDLVSLVIFACSSAKASARSFGFGVFSWVVRGVISEPWNFPARVGCEVLTNDSKKQA